ncbi:serine protease [Bacillaceae bacterium JMAK1]|nr:serine protease [Bacillaceae bacterium JMAK1]
MNKIVGTVIISMILVTNGSVYASTQEEESVWQRLDAAIESWIGDLNLYEVMESFNDWLSAILPFDIEQEEQERTEPNLPELDEPGTQQFAVHNIELGDVREDVEEEVGEVQRATLNDYGVDWEAYHENYHQFIMVSYDDQDQVRALFTNQELVTSEFGIEHGSPRQSVQDALGEPLEVMTKGLMRYQINSNGEYDIYELDGSFVTIFYDQHEEQTVTAIQIIDESLEQQRSEFYAGESQELIEGFEYQLFDLTNAARVQHGLSPLTWSEDVRGTARDHSEDMAEHEYFDHNNQAGQTPFDRMEEDNISFTRAGENLAYGQASSIFAHEGLMNSLGHRENILEGQFERLGVGVALNEENQPYFTEKFYR